MKPPRMVLGLLVLAALPASADDHLDQVLERMMADAHLPGLASVIVRGDEPIWQQDYGWADLDDQIPVTDSTSFMLASISKTFVGTALMQLWEDDAFELDDPINDYLDFPVTNVFHPDVAITFRHLLTHASSIKGDFHPDGLDIPPFTWGYDHPMTLGEFLPEFFVRGGDHYHDTNYNDYPPGTEFDYSSVATALIAYLVERLSGQTFEDYCREHIFLPLGMEDTSWFLANINLANHASHYTWENNQYVEWPPRGTPIYPCGWLKTSALHLTPYLIAYMNGGMVNGVRILEEATVDSMQTVQYPDMEVYFANMRWGLMTCEYTLDDRILWGHEGGSLGVTTLMYYCLEEENGAIMLSNGMDPNCMIGVVGDLLDYALQAASVPDLETRILFENHPNPFYGITRVRFQLTREGPVRLGVYDLTGRVVRSLIQGIRPAGIHDIDWDGADDSGQRVDSGVYLFRLDAGRQQLIRKVTLVK